MGDRLGIQVAIDTLPGFALSGHQTDRLTTPWMNLSLLKEQEGRVDIKSFGEVNAKSPRRMSTFSGSYA